jgi:hypothetical protein
VEAFYRITTTIRPSEREALPLEKVLQTYPEELFGHAI